MNILDKAILRGLSSGDIPFHDLMNAFDIKVSISFNLDSKVHGIVYFSRKSNYHIILNGSISYETQCKVFLHEVKHIQEHLPKMTYIVGIDMQIQSFEIDNIV